MDPVILNLQIIAKPKPKPEPNLASSKKIIFSD